MRNTPQTFGPAVGPPKKRPFAVFDLESKKDDSQQRGFTRPFMAGFYDGQAFTCVKNEPFVQKLPWYERAITRGGCIDNLMRLLLGPLEARGESPYKGHDIYAHNMGGFDGLFLPAWLERNNQHVSYKIMHVQSRIQVLEIWKFNKNRYRGSEEARKRANKKDREQHGVIRILDSFRIMPSSLEKLAKAFGLGEKFKESSDGKEFDLDLHETDSLWDDYNRVDCELLFHILTKYKDLVYGMGGDVGITAPSTAVKLLQRKYLPDPSNYVIQRNIHFRDCPQDGQCGGCAHEFFRTAYFGGRTEIYMSALIGWYYDVNSSYPFSMSKPMPVGDMIELGVNEDFSRYCNEEYVGFVRCTVEIPETAYLPPLPVQHGGKLKFPAGRFSGTWDWVELAALGRIGGRILHIEKSVWVRAHPFMKKYVDDLYWLRNKKNPDYMKAMDEIAKLMLNSTFGKYGMEQDREEIIILKPGEPEPYVARYPGESEEHRKMRKEAAEEGDQSYHVTTPLPQETTENFEKRRKAEREGDYKSYRWRIPEMPGGSGIYEHDSLVRIRDVRVDAAYIIPHIAAHITASSRILLWAYAIQIVTRCQTCQKCKKSYSEHLTCTLCKRSIAEHKKLASTPEIEALDAECRELAWDRECLPDSEDDDPPGTKFTSFCPFQPCQLNQDEHEGARCKFDPYQVAYSDTDSIVTNYPGFPDSKELGGLKKEYDGEPVAIDCYAPKMYRVSKGTNFGGEHRKDSEGKKMCLETCPGCDKPGEHLIDSKGKKKCEKKCPGCARSKIMMKGIPSAMRTFETITKLRQGGAVKYEQLQKLGAIAKKGFRETPFTLDVEKTMKSKYDKRTLFEDGKTAPIVLDGERYLSELYKALPNAYQPPAWLERILTTYDDYS